MNNQAVSASVLSSFRKLSLGIASWLAAASVCDGSSSGFPGTAYYLAIRCAQEGKTSAADSAAFLKTTMQLPDDSSLVSDVKTLLQDGAVQAVVSDLSTAKVPRSSPAYDLAIMEKFGNVPGFSTGAMVTPTSPPSVEKANPSVTPKRTTAENITTGYKEFARYSQTRQIYIAKSFEADLTKARGDYQQASAASNGNWVAAGTERWRSFMKVETDPVAGMWKSPAEIQTVTSVVHPEFGDLLQRLGESPLSSDKASKPTTGTTDASKAPDSSGADATDKADSSNKAKTALKADSQPKVNSDVTLRNAGFSFSSGLGVIASKHSNDAIATLMFRWNMFQRESTIKWNYKVARNNKDGYKAIAYYGTTGGKLVVDQLGQSATVEQVDSLLGSNWNSLTFCGPFVGGAIVGDKVNFGHNADGTARSERPYLVGWGFGWGFYDEAASAVYLDIGASVSPTKGFAYSRPYIGVTLDAIALGKALDWIRKGSGSDSKAGDDGK